MEKDIIQGQKYLIYYALNRFKLSNAWQPRQTLAEAEYTGALMSWDEMKKNEKMNY